MIGAQDCLVPECGAFASLPAVLCLRSKCTRWHTHDQSATPNHSQPASQPAGQADRQPGRHAVAQTRRQPGTDRHGDADTDTQTHRHTDRQTDGQTDTHTHTATETSALVNAEVCRTERKPDISIKKEGETAGKTPGHMPELLQRPATIRASVAPTMLRLRPWQRSQRFVQKKPAYFLPAAVRGGAAW